MDPFDINGWWTGAINYLGTSYRSPNHWIGNKGRRAVVLHITDGVDSRGWLCNAKSQVSAHFLIREEGIYQLVSVNNSSWANGIWETGHQWTGVPEKENPNRYTISIEREGKPSVALSQAIEAHTTRLLQALASLYPSFRPYVPHQNLIGHYEISPHHRPNCPGKLADFERIASAANAALPDHGDTLPGRALLTEDTLILSPPRATLEQCVAYVLGRDHTEYTDDDIKHTILPTYFTVCQNVGIDPLVAIAQMIHETGNLRSWWCTRPRRNPAGIGVTGATRSLDASKPGADWVEDHAFKLWREGVSFITWKDHAIPAHVGRLLAYALPAGVGTSEQRAMRAIGVIHRELPTKAWGSAQTLKQLGAKHNLANAGLPKNKWVAGWAWDGDTYGAKIAAIANAIRGIT